MKHSLLKHHVLNTGQVYVVAAVVINQEPLLSSKGICHCPRGGPQGKPLFACVHIKFSIDKNLVCCFPAPSFTLLEIHSETEGEQGSKGDLREYRKVSCFLGEAEHGGSFILHHSQLGELSPHTVLSSDSSSGRISYWHLKGFTMSLRISYTVIWLYSTSLPQLFPDPSWFSFT